MSGVRRAIPRSPSAASLMSREVTTLFLGLGAWGFGLGLGLRCWCGRRRGLVLVFVDFGFVFVFLDDARHVYDQIAGREIHDFDALCVAAGDADAFDRHADHDPFL